MNGREIAVFGEVVEQRIQSGAITQRTTRDGKDFLTQLGQHTPLETGWLPPGVRSYRQAGDHAQMVVEVPPGLHLVIWGAREGDSSAKTYLLAQPWTYVIGDFLGGEFLGARMFYTPEQVTDPTSAQMYLINLPNVNTIGYRGNGVGWLCHYHRERWADYSIAEKAARLAIRASGQEAYNDANMSETDGTRFYRQHRPDQRFLWDPATWEKKSEAEGFEWTLDRQLWIPALVTGIDSQANHDPTGVPLTLEMAMVGNAACYYGDTYLPKPINALTRGLELAMDTLGDKVYGPSFAQSKEYIRYEPCQICKQDTDTRTLQTLERVGRICEKCQAMRVFECGRCGQSTSIENWTENYDTAEGFCPDCYHDHLCENEECGHRHEDNTAFWLFDLPQRCSCCTPSIECASCHHTVSMGGTEAFFVHGVATNFCRECLKERGVCGDCGEVLPRSELTTTPKYGELCTSCRTTCNECGSVCTKKVVNKSGMCLKCMIVRKVSEKK